MPVSDLIEFILYIAPGFIALELYCAAYPAKERNQFAQITWSMIFGILIFIFIRWVDENFLSYFLNSKISGFPTFRFILVLFIAGLLLGYLRIAFHYFLFKLSLLHDRLKFMAPDTQSIWAKINENSNKDWAVVFVNDSSIYLGWISMYTYNPNVENQDFLLSKARRVDETLNTLYIIDGQGVYLNTKDVKRIEFVQGNKINKI
jgi:hypothetical protein